MGGAVFYRVTIDSNIRGGAREEIVKGVWHESSRVPIDSNPIVQKLVAYLWSSPGHSTSTQYQH